MGKLNWRQTDERIWAGGCQGNTQSEAGDLWGRWPWWRSCQAPWKGEWKWKKIQMRVRAKGMMLLSWLRTWPILMFLTPLQKKMPPKTPTKIKMNNLINTMRKWIHSEKYAGGALEDSVAGPRKRGTRHTGRCVAWGPARTGAPSRTPSLRCTTGPPQPTATPLWDGLLGRQMNCLGENHWQSAHRWATLFCRCLPKQVEVNETETLEKKAAEKKSNKQTNTGKIKRNKGLGEFGVPAVQRKTWFLFGNTVVKIHTFSFYPNIIQQWQRGQRKETWFKMLSIKRNFILQQKAKNWGEYTKKFTKNQTHKKSAYTFFLLSDHLPIQKKPPSEIW